MNVVPQWCHLVCHRWHCALSWCRSGAVLYAFWLVELQDIQCSQLISESKCNGIGNSKGDREEMRGKKCQRLREIKRERQIDVIHLYIERDRNREWWEKKREIESETESEREKEKEWEIERDRESETKRELDRERETERETERKRQGERGRNR